MPHSSPDEAASSTPAFDLALAVVDYCLAAGVQDVVLCPGSRNSPLSFALAQRADLRLHVRIDERSASFLALGLSRVTRRPVPVVMTSGTAVAECLPAVVEAAHSHQRLVVLSADRPARLVGTGASQTIQQRGIFSTLIPTHHIDAPEEASEIPGLLASAGAGPCHINVAFDQPLLPESLPAGPVGSPQRAAPIAPVVIDHGEVCIDLGRRPLVIAGDEAWEVEELAEVPTIAEPSAPAPFRPVHPLGARLLRRGEISHGEYSVETRPEQVIVVGHPTLHREVLGLISDPDIELICLSRTPQFTDLGRRAAQYGSRVRTVGEVDSSWLKVCEAVSTLGADTVREVLASKDFGLTGVHVAAAVTDGLGVGDTLVLGSSNPVRDASWVGLPFGGVDTFTPRGAAGIDGTISQAVGVALAQQSLAAEEPRAPRTVALLGDLTFLHDVGGLCIGPREPRPEHLTIVVANDTGGAIFEGLESGAPGLRAHFERVMATPHETSLADICAGYGVAHRGVDTLDALLEALAEGTDSPEGIEVIEVTTVRDTRRALLEAIAARMG
ncbi:2-succinyl-5-enolpyruvyl-6-hydroxy-3-cyclohexene-1-carboxylic-acid synthase [Corynebacterium uropygiale]|uniref:2-succinyl-5-enolpyruvyl-6-hydroxy-3-cyclohexene-1-carboxylate synthase n=1 Tax=Corynebacterium uropygiale TaxID=1775911 RepID=A0A9X1QPK2_9CORY|nr:2-succinyl-5-enolpyruvyl-6-hydroxy-3-cyclohexene-1-carboxylic-acid synthase [Corynebacterium uropygiale]MCF4005845.1 2-succinyl-5-enolpyruvyl-6-hydroxy-3-cyclohexene-1-carboxylic-acid synthase [Corynebacterium uropygiale]